MSPDGHQEQCDNVLVYQTFQAVILASPLDQSYNILPVRVLHKFLWLDASDHKSYYKATLCHHEESILNFRVASLLCYCFINMVSFKSLFSYIVVALRLRLGMTAPVDEKRQTSTVPSFVKDYGKAISPRLLSAPY